MDGNRLADDETILDQAANVVPYSVVNSDQVVLFVCVCMCLLMSSRGAELCILYCLYLFDCMCFCLCVLGITLVMVFCILMCLCLCFVCDFV